MKEKIGILIILSALLGGILSYLFFREGTEKHKITLYGNVDIRQTDLGFRVGGRLKSLFKEEGDLVNSKELLGELDADIYEEKQKQAEEKVKALTAQVELLEQQIKRRKELIQNEAISKEEYEDLEYQKKIAAANLEEARGLQREAAIQLKDTKLYSLEEGVVKTRIREPGAVVKAGDPIVAVTLPKPIWIRTYVTEPQLGMIYPGMKADIITDTPGSPIYKGQVGFISPVAEFTPKNVETAQLRTDLVYQIRVVVKEDERGLRQGMPVTIHLNPKAHE